MTLNDSLQITMKNAACLQISSMGWALLEFQQLGGEKARVASTLPIASKVVIASDDEFALAYLPLARKSAQKIALVLPETWSEQLPLLKAFGVDLVRAPLDSLMAVASRLASHTGSILVTETYAPHVYTSLMDSLKSQLDVETLVAYCHSQEQFQCLNACFTTAFPNGQLLGVTLDKHLALENVTLISERDAYMTARELIASEGLAVGIHSGACAFMAKTLPTSQTIVYMCGDSASRYTSTLLNEDWLVEHEMASLSTLGQKYRGASVEDLQLPEAVCVFDSDAVGNAINLMVSRDFSQVPVVNAKRKIVGLLTVENGPNREQWNTLANEPVKKWMHTFSKNEPFKLITPDTALVELETFFDHHSAAFVTDESGKFVLAVCTKIDLLKFLVRRTQ